MPLVAPSVAASRESARIVRVPGLPDFNVDYSWTVSSEFMAWFAPSGRALTLVERGSAPGSRAVRSRPVAKRLPFSGAIQAGSFAEAEESWALLYGAFAAAGLDGLPVTVAGAGGRPDMTAWLILDEETPSFDQVGPYAWEFSLPTVQTDPLRYSPIATLGSAGAFVGLGAYRTYVESAAGDEGWRFYDPATGARYYSTDDASGGLPGVIVVVNDGDTDSRRFTLEVSGPLDADDYEVVNETTGQRLGAGLTLIAGQSLVLDMHARRAVLNEQVVTEYVSGEWLRLLPGPNTLRLYVGTPTAEASMTVTEAWSASL